MEFTKDFLDKLIDSEKLVFFTGAGISAESGIPTFRGEGGIWEKFRPEELANFDAFIKNPDLVWEWYQYRRDIIFNAEPNPGHKAIAELQNYFKEVTVVTQNIDNLHRRAGSENVFELHGNIERNYCYKCKKEYDMEPLKEAKEVPKCECGGLIRPDVVWFGEPLPQDEFLGGEKAARECDIMFVAGTSAIVYPAAFIPLEAKKQGKYLVEVNTQTTDMSYEMDKIFTGKAGEVLPQIVEKVKELKQGQ